MGVPYSSGALAERLRRGLQNLLDEFDSRTCLHLNMKEFFTGQPRNYTRGVAVVSWRRGGLLLERINNRLDLIRGIVQDGEDDEAAAIRLLKSRLDESFEPVPLRVSLTEMDENPTEYHLMEIVDPSEIIPDDAAEGVGYYSQSHMNKLFMAGIGATAVLGAVLGARIIRSRHQGE